MKGRVIEVVGSLAVGGAERVALEIAAGLNARDWRVTLLIAGSGDGRANSGFTRSVEGEAAARGIEVRHAAFSSLFDPKSLREVSHFLSEQHADLVHVHNRPQDWQLSLLGRVLRRPTLYTIHLAYDVTRRQQALYAVAARAARHVVCVSHAVANHARVAERIPERKLSVIHNGIRLEVFAVPPPEVRQAKRDAMGWSDQDFVWLCAARLFEQKGHAHLLDGFGQLPRASQARLVLAGDGPLLESLQTRAHALPNSDRITFLGPRRDIPELLGMADGFATATLQEGHPLALLEAMAMDLPVVAPRLPSVLEIATKDNPVLFGPAISPGAWAPGHAADDVAAALWSVEQERDRWKGYNGRTHVAESFSLDAMISKHEELYSMLLGARPRIYAPRPESRGVQTNAK